jgi:TolA protein
MKKLLLILVSLFLTFEIASADQLEDGLAAYRDGDYAIALKLLRPLAKQGNAKAQEYLVLLKKEVEIEERQKRQEADEKQQRRDADARTVTAMGNEVAAYKAKIRAKIRRNILMPSDIPKDALAEFDVRLFSGGVVLNVKLVKSSGSEMYDRAVERAIKKSDPLPVPPEGLLSNQFRELHLNFSPNE